VGGVFIALFATGCGPSSAGTHKHTVQGCAAYGLHAIRHRVTVYWKPAPCQGLSKTEVNEAVALAVARAAGDARKAIRREREGEAAPYLAHLVSVLPPGASASSSGTRSAATSSRNLPMAIAALIAWLVTAGSGAYVLGSWIARGGSLRRGARGAGTGSPPAMLLGHFGLALCGLALWVVYLVTGWAALAWVAVGVLLPVAGLGMATLVNGLPGRRAASPQGNGGETGPGGNDAAAGDAAVIQVAGADTSGSTRTATIGASSPGTAGASTVPVRARLAPMVVAAHGALAVTTMILVLLAALGGAAN
jgi:manganese efflux pump family protein